MVHNNIKMLNNSISPDITDKIIDAILIPFTLLEQQRIKPKKQEAPSPNIKPYKTIYTIISNGKIKTSAKELSPEGKPIPEQKHVKVITALTTNNIQLITKLTIFLSLDLDRFFNNIFYISF